MNLLSFIVLEKYNERKTMRFLEYLFFKYYNWQIKVGNGDIPTLMSLLSITVCFDLYFMDIVTSYFFFLKPIGTPFVSMSVFIVAYILFFILLYFLLCRRGKDKEILEKHQNEWRNRKSLGAILFPIVAFIWFNANNIIKMLMNRGVL